MSRLKIAYGAAALVASCVALHASAMADALNLPTLLDIRTARPGQYADFVDYNSKRPLNVAGLPNSLLRPFMACEAKVLYDMITSQNRATLDSAAKYKGLSPANRQKLSAAFGNKYDASQSADALGKACRPSLAPLAKKLGLDYDDAALAAVGTWY
ncbi:MAG TPA: hypothetical protein VGM59_18445 [Dongiaceae bacterium]